MMLWVYIYVAPLLRGWVRFRENESDVSCGCCQIRYVQIDLEKPFQARFHDNESGFSILQRSDEQFGSYSVKTKVWGTDRQTKAICQIVSWVDQRISNQAAATWLGDGFWTLICVHWLSMKLKNPDLLSWNLCWHCFYKPIHAYLILQQPSDWMILLVLKTQFLWNLAWDCFLGPNSSLDLDEIDETENPDYR